MRDHVYLSLAELGEALGFHGQIIRVRMEEESEFLHLLVETDLPPQTDTSYSEARRWQAKSA